MAVLFRAVALSLVAALSTAASTSAQQRQQDQALQSTTTVQKQAKKDPYGLSDRFVRVMQGLAWDRMPTKLEFQGKMIELDKSDPNKFMLPLDEAREVIVIADRSATAILCDMEESALTNFHALMEAEEASKKWSHEQLHMIKWLHIAVVMVRTEDRTEQVAAADQASQGEAVKRVVSAKERARKEGLCTAENKARVQENIDKYVKSVAMRTGKTIDKMPRSP